MEHLDFKRILLLLMTFSATWANIVQTFYDQVEPGHNITGTIMAELNARSKIQCSNKLVYFFGKMTSIYFIK